MHVQFNPEDYNVWLDYYAGQATQTGFGLEGFRGIPYQRGGGLGSFFRSLFRMAIPVIKSVGRQVGKHALTAGASIATDVAKGRPLFESAKEHSKRETSQLLQEASEALQQSQNGPLMGALSGPHMGAHTGPLMGPLKGEGLGIRPKSINTIDVFTKIKQKDGSRRHKIDSKY